jgi:hypothetical protein
MNVTGSYGQVLPTLSRLSVSAILPFDFDFQLALDIECGRFDLFSGSLKMQLHPSDFGSSLVEPK